MVCNGSCSHTIILNSTPTGQPDRRGSSHGPLKTNSEEDPYELHLGYCVQPHRDPNCRRSACPHWSDPTAVDGQYRHGVQLCLRGQQLSAAKVVSRAKEDSLAFSDCFKCIMS